MIRTNSGGNDPLQNSTPSFTVNAAKLTETLEKKSLSKTTPARESNRLVSAYINTPTIDYTFTDHSILNITDQTQATLSVDWLDAIDGFTNTASTAQAYADSDWNIRAQSYLNPSERQELQKLPLHFRHQILEVNEKDSKEGIHKQIAERTQTVINQLVQNGTVSFKSRDGETWELESLLSLASAVNHLPIAQRKQLANTSFIRAAYPETPKNLKMGLLAQVANKSVAGHYDILSQSIILYNRGLKDDFPELGQELKQSLRTIHNAGHADEIGDLQKMLNPYLTAMGESSIAEDSQWGNTTARAVRMVQMELLSRHVGQHHQLTPQQKDEISRLKVLAASSQFDMITRMTDIRDKMQNLNLLPDPHMKQLLEEFSRSEFGEASLRFLMQDISSDFRAQNNNTNSRIEDLMVHEMGHHFQLGLKNESHYISEFSKFSNWRETNNDQRADGYIQGGYTGEDILDVYNVLASDATVDEGKYKAQLSPEERSQKFVTSYAATDPMEDFAESYRTFVLYPKTLLQAAPEKFFFINALPSIQARKTGAGDREKAHYQAQEIETLVRQVLAERYQATPTQEHIKGFIRDNFENIMGSNREQQKFHLDPDVIMSIVETHKTLLQRADMPYIPTERIYQQNNPDMEVYQELNSKTQALIVSGGKDKKALEFFSNFTSPQKVDALFPGASEDLKKQLKDPSFSSMMMVLGQIGGHAYYINQLQNKDISDNRDYQTAQSFFNTVAAEPSALLSKQTFGHAWNYLRGVTAEVFNPEEIKVDSAIQFFQNLQDNPEKVFPQQWKSLPDEFKKLLQDKRFVKSISGDQGRYLPSPENIRKTLEQVMEAVEYERRMQAVLGKQ